MTLSIIVECCFAECNLYCVNYAELNKLIKLSVILLSVVLLSVDMLSVVMLSDVVLSVVAP